MTNFKTVISGIFTLLFAAGICSPASGQTIWPGDVNNNGIVNGIDLLYIGLAFGQTGPARQNASTDWQGQPVTTLWQGSFPDGINFAYADCNGDGIVDDEDIDDAIEENFGLTHGALRPDVYQNGLPGIDPPSMLTPNLDIVEPGTPVNIALDLGTAAFPVNDFHGIAMKFSYTGNLIDDASEVDFEDENDGWANPSGGSNPEVLLIADKSTGKGELAITRTDQQSIPEGAGFIGRFSIIIEDIIVGLEQERLDFRIDSIKLIDRDLNTMAVVPDTTSILIVPDTSVVTDLEVLEIPRTEVFPNPAHRSVHIQSEAPVEWVKLYSLVGREVDVKVRTLGGHALTLLPAQPLSGIYLLEVYTGGVIQTKKISFIQN